MMAELQKLSQSRAKPSSGNTTGYLGTHQIFVRCVCPYKDESYK